MTNLINFDIQLNRSEAEIIRSNLVNLELSPKLPEDVNLNLRWAYTIFRAFILSENFRNKEIVAAALIYSRDVESKYDILRSDLNGEWHQARETLNKRYPGYYLEYLHSLELETSES